MVRAAGLGSERDSLVLDFVAPRDQMLDFAAPQDRRVHLGP